MRFIHTFWSKPLYENMFGDFETSLNNILIDYACSAACVHKNGREIILYADKRGAELLSIIPYDKVVIVDDMDNESISFAAQIKFKALKEIELGDAIIDGDLFLKERECVDIIESSTEDVIYSFFEPYLYTLSTSGLLEMNNGLVKSLHGVEFKEPYKLPLLLEDYGWMNLSLMCIRNQGLKDKYIEQYEYHKNLLSKIDFKKFSSKLIWPDVIIEQYFLTLLTRFGNYSTKPIIENFFYDQKANDYALKIGFTHLGSAKTQFLQYIEMLLKELNPVLHQKTKNRINKIINENK